MEKEKQLRQQMLERARQNMVAIAALFEGGLALLAWLLGWAFSYPPAETIRWLLADVGYGVLWTLPLVPLMLFVGRSRLRPFVRIQNVVNAIIVPLFSGCSLFQLAMISALAGIGEEALFRGFIQNSLSSEGNIWTGIVIASFLFGLAHMVTPTYAVLATIMGFYLGWLMHFHENLLVPITVHAVYDFVALVYLVRLNPQSRTVLRQTMRDMDELLNKQLSMDGSAAENHPPTSGDNEAEAENADSAVEADDKTEG